MKAVIKFEVEPKLTIGEVQKIKDFLIDEYCIEPTVEIEQNARKCPKTKLNILCLEKKCTNDCEICRIQSGYLADCINGVLS